MEYSRRGHVSGRKSLTKENMVLHYGKCSRECFWNLTPFKSQDIKAFAASILMIWKKSVSWKLSKFVEFI